MPNLYDYQTGEFVREATALELADSIAAAESDGGAGVIQVDWRADGGWHGEDYRLCYVLE